MTAAPPRTHEIREAGPATSEAFSAPNSQPDPMIEPTDANSSPTRPTSRRSLRPSTGDAAAVVEPTLISSYLPFAKEPAMSGATPLLREMMRVGPRLSSGTAAASSGTLRSGSLRVRSAHDLGLGPAPLHGPPALALHVDHADAAGDEPAGLGVVSPAGGVEIALEPVRGQLVGRVGIDLEPAPGHPESTLAPHRIVKGQLIEGVGELFGAHIVLHRRARFSFSRGLGAVAPALDAGGRHRLARQGTRGATTVAQ